MPPNRRNIVRSVSLKPISGDDRLGAICDPSLINVNFPKHVPVPEIPTDSELTFELLAFTSALVAMGSQYLNLYRTVWWLPHSHMDYAMNFYLIDTYVAVFCMIMVGRRLPLSVIKKIMLLVLPISAQANGLHFCRLFSASLVLPCLCWCIYKVLPTHGILSLFCLGYPALVYVILFGPSLLPAFEIPNLKSIERGAKSSKAGKSDSIVHICSWSADSVREEVETLKADFNARLKYILFNSLLVAYYTAFVPCCYAQNSLHYDTLWVSQHIGFVWLSNFCMYIIYCFPPHYCDILHRSALHLGRWQKMEARNVHIPCSIWSNDILWLQGALVKHFKEIYRAEGTTNAAEPGNPAHSRFYAVFSNPMGAISGLLGLQVTLIVVLVGVLICSSEWNHIIAIASLLLLNFPTQFKVSRAYLVLGKIYHAEQVMQEKLNS